MAPSGPSRRNRGHTTAAKAMRWIFSFEQEVPAKTERRHQQQRGQGKCTRQARKSDPEMIEQAAQRGPNSARRGVQSTCWTAHSDIITLRKPAKPASSRHAPDCAARRGLRQTACTGGRLVTCAAPMESRLVMNLFRAAFAREGAPFALCALARAGRPAEW